MVHLSVNLGGEICQQLQNSFVLNVVKVSIPTVAGVGTCSVTIVTTSVLFVIYAAKGARTTVRLNVTCYVILMSARSSVICVGEHSSIKKR